MTLELAKPRPIWQIMFSTHHTDIGLLYLITSLAFLFMGGSLALIIRFGGLNLRNCLNLLSATLATLNISAPLYLAWR